MRVLHVITGLMAGGAETQLRVLLRHTRHDCDVVTLYNAGSIADDMQADGISVTNLGMRSNTELSAVRRLARIIREGNYDVVHCHLYRALLYGRLAARMARAPVVVATEHSLLDGRLEGRETTRGVRLLYQAVEPLGDMTVAVSRAVEGRLREWKVPERRLTYIPNGLDLETLAFSAEARHAIRTRFDIPADAIVLGTVGRMHPGKLLPELLDASAPLLSPECRLLMVGDGTERSALEQQASELGIEKFVVFTGEMPAPPALSAMDLFVSPSVSETFGLSVLEALASGLPTAYRLSPALDELERPVRQAHLVSSDPNALQETLASLIAELPVSDRACPPELNHYSITHVVAQLDNLYETLFESRAQRRPLLSKVVR